MDFQKYKSLILIALPLVLTFSCTAVFKWAAITYGHKAGYLTGFLFYWLFWCLFIPVQLIGTKAILDFYSFKHLTFNWQIMAFLIVPLIFVYTYEFPSALKKASVTIILLSLLIAVVNASLEEVLWRAVYINVFKEKKALSILYASIGFAIWHYAPQIVSVNKRPGGAHSFVLFSFFLGLAYAWVAWKQQSIFWVTVAHILFDYGGLGARVYF